MRVESNDPTTRIWAHARALSRKKSGGWGAARPFTGLLPCVLAALATIYGLHSAVQRNAYMCLR